MTPGRAAHPGPPAHSDVTVVGGGAAGLSLAHRLTETGAATVTVIEPPDGPLRPAERTWCYWHAGTDGLEDAVTTTWPLLRVHGADGRPVTVDPAPFTYRMLRSTDFENLVRGRLAGSDRNRLLRATADAVRSVPGGAEVRCTLPGGRTTTLRSRRVFDSRPLPALPPARTQLLQHFRGWFVRTATARFDPGIADLMDFRVPQPSHGLAFGYVLPLAPDRALVEYTEFSRRTLTTPAYESALGHYCRDVLRLGPFTVERTEQGLIPMTDARFRHRAGASVFRIGTAGGATRPATGYTFAAVQRQSRAIAAALRAGRGTVPAPHGRRALAMDAIMLRALDTGRIDGPAFFTGLFRHVPAERLLRFLDGTASLREDWGIGLRTPVRPMLATAAELPFLPRRTRPLTEAGAPHR
ncbi:MULTISPECIES: lycopene cyclase family protein [unclassified Streptomyces]|uniref:lycopene cyclase family protein n=1 Tax=unclassified Streptomyces TaxID=2593676 RepID=UPI000DAE360C|nr:MULTISPECIES: lycopene cyclase family protein [unclassified Streptomyces]PZT73392.1 lycopene cyclase [Streptomyces sp. AC1-42T]PZT83619.1 lycopene cyclase [Streptomyces sp. AC1-42W]